ncbi:hypothetical protein QPK87_13780 [Kamptonema cortianum]|nr:hypothetical protein [Geitlerinema splendidum]MDK3157638.1 hypothetical protein [Kamptonema cortianum]
MIDFEFFGAIGILLVIFSVPIAAILTHHQRKMAELMHSRGELGQQRASEVHGLRLEVQHLQNRVNEQALQIEELQTALGNRVASVADRVRENS